MKNRSYILLRLAAAGAAASLALTPVYADTSSTTAAETTEASTTAFSFDEDSEYMKIFNEVAEATADAATDDSTDDEMETQTTLVYSPSLDEYDYPSDAVTAQMMADEKGFVVIGSLAFIHAYEEANPDDFQNIQDELDEEDRLMIALASGDIAKFAETYFADGAHADEAQPSSAEDFKAKQSSAIANAQKSDATPEYAMYDETVYYGIGADAEEAFAKYAGDNTAGNCNLIILEDRTDPDSIIPASILSKTGETDETANLLLILSDDETNSHSVYLTLSDVTTDNDLNLYGTTTTNEDGNYVINFEESADLGYDVTYNCMLPTTGRITYTVTIDGEEIGDVTSTSRGKVTFTTSKIGKIVFAYKEAYYQIEDGNYPDIVPEGSPVAQQEAERKAAAAEAEAEAAEDAAEESSSSGTAKKIAIPIIAGAACGVCIGLVHKRKKGSNGSKKKTKKR